jgi:hypothetical protein
MQDRRTALKVIGATAALPALAQEHAGHEATTGTAAAKYTAKVFDREQLALLAELTDRILPRTDTPGAADAQVPLLIDRAAQASPQAAQAWKALLGWFAANGRTPEARLELLKRGSAESGTEAARHFKLLKDTTIDRYYATREGLVQELGWSGNSYLTEFQGCTHPEHQA